MIGTLLKDGLKDVIPLVEKSAPLLGLALKSSPGGFALSLLADAFGSTDLKDLTDKILNDPNAPGTLLGLQATHAEMLSYLTSFKPPSSIEINVKVMFPVDLN